MLFSEFSPLCVLSSSRFFLNNSGSCRMVTTEKWKKTKKNLNSKLNYIHIVYTFNVLISFSGFSPTTATIVTTISENSVLETPIHCGLKSEKKCNLWKPHCLPQRLKSTFFEIFSNGVLPQKGGRACGVKKIFKKRWF